MIKKLGNKSLLLILVLLLAVFLIARYFSTRNGENTFKTAIIPHIDTNRMNGMVIFQKPTKTGKPLPFIFTLKGKKWYVSQGQCYRAGAERRSPIHDKPVGTYKPGQACIERVRSRLERL